MRDTHPGTQCYFKVILSKLVFSKTFCEVRCLFPLLSLVIITKRILMLLIFIHNYFSFHSEFGPMPKV